MWWVGSRHPAWADVFLGEHLVAVARRGDGLRHGASQSLPDALSLARGWLDAGPRRRLRIWLGGTLCQPLLLPQIVGAANSAEVHVAASVLAAESTSLGEGCDVWIDARPSRVGTMAVAIPGTLVASITESLAPAGRIFSIQPWWSEALRWSLRSVTPTPQLIGVDDGESLTILSGSGGEFDAAHCIAPMRDQATTRATWARALMVSDKPADRVSLVRLDFARTRSARNPGFAFGNWFQQEVP